MSKQDNTPAATEADQTPKIRYMEGRPKQYRFDAKAGMFNIGGVKEVGRTLTFQPIAWRIFTDNILNQGTKNWAEIFFVDEQNALSAVLFHSYSVDALFRLIEPLFYDDLTLADVVITVVPDKKENNNIQPKGVYYIASFTYVKAEVSEVERLSAFAKENRIFRQETLTGVANVETSYRFFNPFDHGSALDAGFIPKLPVDIETGEALSQ